MAIRMVFPDLAGLSLEKRKTVFNKLSNTSTFTRLIKTNLKPVSKSRLSKIEVIKYLNVSFLVNS